MWIAIFLAFIITGSIVLMLLKQLFPDRKRIKVLSTLIFIGISGLIMFKVVFDSFENVSLKNKKKYKIEQLTVDEIEYVNLYKLPWSDSILFNSRDTIAAIINEIKNSEVSSYSHPGVKCELIFSIVLKNGNEINFQIFDSTSGTFILLISEVHYGSRLGTFRNDKLQKYVKMLCNKLYSNEYKSFTSRSRLIPSDQ